MRSAARFGQVEAALLRLRPVRFVARWHERRPLLTSWAALATSMVILVVLFGKDAGLTFGQHTALALVTVGVAWLCAWIICLADREADADGDA
jgi:hypothetical protein